MDDPLVGVIVVAGGSGTRLGLALPKAFVPVGAITILEHSLQAVFAMRAEGRVVVVVPEAQLPVARSLCERIAGAAAPALTVVSGGSSRQASVAAGLSVLDPDASVVLVHDAARAFTPPEQFDLVEKAVRATGAGVIPALPVSDTIKRADSSGAVQGTVDRSELVAVQTPQGFPRAELEAAYAAATTEYTDDAALYSAAGHPVSVVAGDALAFKITTAWDLRRAESIAAEAATSSEAERRAASAVTRTGIGFDVHAFDAAAPLWLGGVLWPGEPGLAGHSDGDAVSHAVCDALLSAAGLGDIGSRFGTSDPVYSGAHGDVFIGATVTLLSEAGWTVGNVAVQVIALRPRLAARRAELEGRLRSLVMAPVSVSATTTDGLGFTGRGEGVAVIATALVERAG